MKKIILALFSLLTGSMVYSQAKVLTENEKNKLIVDSVKQQFGLNFPVRLVYSYSDKTGSYYLALCEQFESVLDGDTLTSRIKAVNWSVEKGGFVKKWEMNDFIRNDSSETSIWFWTKYTTIKDIDGDGVAEPVMVYGSSGMNGYEDGRVKILIYYKGQKVGIRHQSSVLDEGRYTDVDAAFYTLPERIQEYVKNLIQVLEKNGLGYFSYQVEEGMKKKKTHIE